MMFAIVFEFTVRAAKKIYVDRAAAAIVTQEEIGTEPLYNYSFKIPYRCNLRLTGNCGTSRETCRAYIDQPLPTVTAGVVTLH
eukprot:g83044.t1